MPTHQSNWKRLRQDQARRLRNISGKSQIRTHMNRVRNAVAAGASQEEVETEYRRAISLLDRAAKKNVIHQKNADRKKSRLARLIRRQQSSDS